MAKLQDLYTRGSSETITDDEGNVSKFWMKKLNPVESKTVINKANAARARHLVAQRDESSDAYLATLSEVLDMSREELLEAAVSKEVGEKAPALEEELKAEKRWSDDDYLQSIQDEWEDHSKLVWVSSRPNDEGVVSDHDYSPEEVETAERIYGELLELIEAYDQALDKFRKSAIRNVERLTLEELEKKAVEAIFDRVANSAWVETFYRWQIFYSTSDHKTKDRYFDTYEEVVSLPLETYTALLTKFRQLEVSNTEAKK